MFISTMLRAEKIIWAKQPRRGLPGIFFSHLKTLLNPVVTFASYKEDGSALPTLKNTLSSAGPGGRSKGVAVPFHAPACELAKKLC